MNDLVIPAAGAVAQWDPNSGAPMPAYLAEAMNELGSNIPDRMTVPSLSYEGKVWTIIKDGNKTKLQAQNQDGDMVPVPVVRGVILNANPERGRAYYEGTYNPAASAAPKCWSPDGKAPDESVREKQAATCAACPMAVKGSKVMEGREMVACSSHRMLAIVPSFDLKFDPLRLKIAVTSDYDKNIVEHGWFAFRQYTDYLKSRSIQHTGLVVTKIKCDPNEAYPKLLFALDRPLTPEELAQVIPLAKSDAVTKLLAEKWTAAGSAGTPVNDSDIKPYGLEGAYADGWQAHPTSPGWSYKGDQVLQNEALAANYPAPPPPAVTAPPPPAAVAPAVPASETVIVVPAAEVAPPPAAAHDPIANALASGWAVHPDNPAYYFKDAEVLDAAALAAKFPAPPTAAPAAPVSAPPPPPAPAPVDPMVAAAADGWAVHPDNAAYWFKDAEVLEAAAVAARYAGNSASAATPAAGTDTSGSGQPATTVASPSDGALPAEVQNLLDKWGGS